MIRRLQTVLDVMRVPSEGDPLSAIVHVDHGSGFLQEECDVLIVGGGMGGTAAALATARRGHKVCLLEETNWLGGQMTSQGVAALDEHEHIEQFGGTRSYYALREGIRRHYRALADESAQFGPINPGNCWVSRLAFEPIVALNEIDRQLSPYIKTGQIRVFLRMKTVEAETEDGDRSIISVKAINLDDRRQLRFSFRYVLDATELGDLLPLTGTDYVVGAESIEHTGEAHAQPGQPKPACVQSCTYTFAMERRPEAEDHRISRPTKYEHYRDTQPYTLRIHVHGGEIYGETSGWLRYQVFNEMPDTKGPLWTYRRLVDSTQFPGHFEHDLTMFNWPGNDYRDMPLVDQSPENLAKAIQDAKRVSLGFAHWLQTEVPNPDGLPGFPNLLLRRDLMGSDDGLSKHPYIRECRRIKAVKTIREQDVSVACQEGPTACRINDSVGIGWYPIDIHPINKDEVGTSSRTWPFQIPLGALIPSGVENLLPANKNIGTTHITNGCYRLHPVEWNIGEAAGLLASFSIEKNTMPRMIHNEQSLLHSFQNFLIDEGIPLCWLVDVPVWSPDFPVVQKLAISQGEMSRDNDLSFFPGRLTKAASRHWSILPNAC